MEVKIMKNIMNENEQLAKENRTLFSQNGVVAVNIMASPGAGKTSIIQTIINCFRTNTNIAVIEGDIASTIDAEKIEKSGIPVIQINTCGGCHLDANVIREAYNSIDLKPKSPKGRKSLLLIENVGNLICPSSFDLGESLKIVIASVPEGHDKPFKYTSMFEAADAVILNKTDLLPYIDFDMNEFYKGVRALKPEIPIFEVSCRTCEGFDALTKWLEQYLI